MSVGRIGLRAGLFRWGCGGVGTAAGGCWFWFWMGSCCCWFLNGEAFWANGGAWKLGCTWYWKQRVGFAATQGTSTVALSSPRPSVTSALIRNATKRCLHSYLSSVPLSSYQAQLMTQPSLSYSQKTRRNKFAMSNCTISAGCLNNLLGHEFFNRLLEGTDLASCYEGNWRNCPWQNAHPRYCCIATNACVAGEGAGTIH